MALASAVPIPRPERLEAIAALQAWWAKEGGPERLVPPDPELDPTAESYAWKLVQDLGGNDLVASTPEKDQDLEAELVAMGKYAVPALVRGLKYPPGFAEKRAAVARALGRIGDRRAAPALAATLRDPVVSVAAWAAWALEPIADPETRGALLRYEQRVRALMAGGAVPTEAGPGERLLAQAARARLRLGDDAARPMLVDLLLSEDETTRSLAIDALSRRFGEDRGYDAAGEPQARRAAAQRWME